MRSTPKAYRNMSMLPLHFCAWLSRMQSTPKAYRHLASRSSPWMAWPGEDVVDAALVL